MPENNGKSLTVENSENWAGCLGIPGYLKNDPVDVLKNVSSGTVSCLRKPLSGRSPVETISTIAQTEAAVVQEIEFHSCPAISFG